MIEQLEISGHFLNKKKKTIMNIKGSVIFGIIITLNVRVIGGDYRLKISAQILIDQLKIWYWYCLIADDWLK